MTLAVLQITPKHGILVLLEAKGLACLDLLVVEHVGLHCVLVSYVIDVPFLLLDRVCLGPGFGLLLLTYERLDGLLVEIGGVTKASTDLLDLPSIAICFNLILLLIRCVHFLQLFLLFELVQKRVICSREVGTVLAGHRAVQVDVCSHYF